MKHLRRSASLILAGALMVTPSLADKTYSRHGTSREDYHQPPTLRQSQPARPTPTSVQPKPPAQTRPVAEARRPSVPQRSPEARRPSVPQRSPEARRPSIPQRSPEARPSVPQRSPEARRPISRPNKPEAERPTSRPNKKPDWVQRPGISRPDRPYYRPQPRGVYNRPYRSWPSYRYSRPSTFISFNVGLPRGSFDFFYGGRHYYEYHGAYYLRTAYGYQYVRPPIGVIIPRLPPGYTSIYAPNGYLYLHDDIYYRDTLAGYEIVKPPVIETEAADESPPPESASEAFMTFQLEEDLYLFRDGQFFVEEERGLVWVDPPIGAVSDTLPPDSQSIWYQEMEYFEFRGIYFLETPEGYQVVDPPWQISGHTEATLN